MLRVIFLDFDGVLITPTSSFRRSHAGSVADPDAVRALNYLVAQTGASLVITSTWRLDYSLSELINLLRFWNVQANILGITRSAPCRADEIRQWLDSFSESASVETFVILDDLTEMGALSSHLVSTEFETGLTMDYVRRALEVLIPPRI